MERHVSRDYSAIIRTRCSSLASTIGESPIQNNHHHHDVVYYSCVSLFSRTMFPCMALGGLHIEAAA